MGKGNRYKGPRNGPGDVPQDANAYKGKKKQGGSAKKITLKDPIPSAISLRVECHKVLWAMVSLIDGYGDVQGNEEILLNGTQYEVKESAPKKRRMDRFGVNDNISESIGHHQNPNFVRDERLGRMTGILLAEEDSRDMWYEHIYMMRHSGCLLPCRVEGVGPSSQQGSHAIVSFLGLLSIWSCVFCDCAL